MTILYFDYDDSCVVVTLLYKNSDAAMRVSASVDLQSLFALWVNLNSEVIADCVHGWSFCLVKTTLSVSVTTESSQHFQQRWSAPQVTHDYMKLLTKGRENAIDSTSLPFNIALRRDGLMMFWI